MLRRKTLGQSTAEYAIVIGLVIGAAVAMQIYVKRGIQGKMKDATDFKVTDSGTGVTIGSTAQYEPYYATSSMTSTRVASESEAVAKGGSSSKTASDTSTRTGTSGISAAK